MTESERRRIFMDGLKRTPLLHGRGGVRELSKAEICGGYSWAFWTARIAGEAKRVALEAEAARGPYLYGSQGYFYETPEAS